MVTKTQIKGQLRFAKKLLADAEDNLKFEKKQIKAIKKNIIMFNRQLKKL